MDEAAHPRLSYRVVLNNGHIVELNDAVLVKDDEVVVLRCGRSEYRFNWSSVAYLIERRK